MTDTKRKDVLEGLEGFTPGPWETKPEELDRNYIRVRGTVPGKKYKVANAHGPAEPTIPHLVEAARANARLIARAPELVEEIRELRATLRDAFIEGYAAAYTVWVDVMGAPDTEVEHAWRYSAARALLPETEDE